MTSTELKRYLIKCCYWYYVKADPIISDYKYDHMFYELRKLENDESMWDEDSPTQIIWGDLGEQYPDWAKIK